ncbi:hypothetical protein [Frigoribacterium sp. CFBP 13707]|uniref:hypothetical protein n=1 Tax=Frigoribacterium sp. CFBP 13707 TaxID=2775313 RepID=UPI00178060C3|nr:hypothetical protein [Frigoribacterium sp. CFBP 13707]
MPEPIARWWARRQWSRGTDVPYEVGRFREAWASFPVLIRQYRPEFNGGVVLTQIPPAADVWLTWLCDAGHLVVATPDEQRSRPGRERRRSSWCPDCTELARPRTPSLPMAATVRLPGDSPLVTGPVAQPSGGSTRGRELEATWAKRRSTAGASGGRPVRSRVPRASPGLCRATPDLPPGEAFVSSCAPPPASAVEAQLRADLTERLEFTPGQNAVRLGKPFFDHVEAWPDIVLPELRVAIEYDSTGRHGLEHVGKREDADRRKDRALRGVGWEVVRVRTGKLPALGPYDLQVGGLGRTTVPLLLDRLREIRGDLLVDAWLRR